MSREPSATQIILDELRDFRSEMKVEMANTKLLAQTAHNRIDKHESRFYGILTGISLIGGSFGAWLNKTFNS